MTLEMLPSFAQTNTVNNGFCYSEGARDFKARTNYIQNGLGDFFSNLRIWMIFATQHGYTMASFAGHVLRIFLLGSKEKMICVDAERNIAFVADAKTGWNWSVAVFPRQSMCELNALLPTKLSIAQMIVGTPPQNAAAFMGPGKESKFLCQRGIARRVDVARLWHSRNRPPQTVAGQGRCPHSHAARPVHYAMVAGAFP